MKTDLSIDEECDWFRGHSQNKQVRIIQMQTKV